MNTTTRRSAPRHNGRTCRRPYPRVWTSSAALTALAFTVLETAGAYHP